MSHKINNRLHQNQDKFLVQLFGKELKDFTTAEFILLVTVTVIIMLGIQFLINRGLRFLAGDNNNNDSEPGTTSMKTHAYLSRNKKSSSSSSYRENPNFALLHPSDIPKEKKIHKNSATWRVENIKETKSHLQLSDNDSTIEWIPNSKKFAWVPVESNLLISEDTEIEFTIHDLKKGQSSVGFMLVFQNDYSTKTTKNTSENFYSVDWGFFGYLGASTTAWSFDASTGDVVSGTKSIEGGLPKLDQNGGKVKLTFKFGDEKKKNNDNFAQFEIEGTKSEKIMLPSSECVVMPATCLLKQGQKVSMKKIC